MAIQITFTVDEDLTERDLREMLQYRNALCAIDELRAFIMRMEEGMIYPDRKKLSKQKIIEIIRERIFRETHQFELD
jgi:hypothetical protein